MSASVLADALVLGFHEGSDSLSSGIILTCCGRDVKAQERSRAGRAVALFVGSRSLDFSLLLRRSTKLSTRIHEFWC